MTLVLTTTYATSQTNNAMSPAAKDFSSCELEPIVGTAAGATPTTLKTVASQQVYALDFLEDLRRKYPHQPIFLQAVEEMAVSLVDLFEDPDKGDFYKRTFIIMTEPERAISFRVPWMDDSGIMQINRGWRIEFNR